MYETKGKTEIFLLAHKEGEWISRIKFEDLNEVLDFLADRCWRDPATGRIFSPILESLNVTGKDVERFCYDSERREPVYERLRDRMFVDVRGSVVNPRIFQNEIFRRFRASEKTKRFLISRRRIGNAEFRKDPVPYTGRRKVMKPRRYKTWFHNRRLDFIPEYSEYVRKNAVLQDDWDWWDGFPPRTVSRSWKDNSKRRCQWK